MQAPPVEVEIPPERLGTTDSPYLPGDRSEGRIMVFKIRPDPPEAKYPLSVRAVIEAVNKEPRVRHHIFPQAFKPFFKERGVNVHDWVMLIPLDEHKRIHRGDRGGPWNADWREWITLHTEDANKEAIYRFAGEMIYRYCLAGTMTRYYCVHSAPKPLPSSPSSPVIEDEY